MPLLIPLGSISIPDADTADVVAALRANYATNGIPVPTNAQLQEYMRQDVISRIKSLTRAYRTAQVAVADPGAT